MARGQSKTVRAKMERLGEIDFELDDLSVIGTATTTPEALFDRLEEHARLRLKLALTLAPEKLRLRPIPADPEPAYIGRLANYFESLQSHANEQRGPGGRFVAEYTANDGRLAAEQLRYAIEGRGLLAEGNIRASVLCMYAVTREFHRYSARLTPAATSIRASSSVGQRRGDWVALGEKRERSLRELRERGYTLTEAGRRIAKSEGLPRKSGENIIRPLRKRFEKRGEPFPSPTRQTPKSTN